MVEAPKQILCVKSFCTFDPNKCSTLNITENRYKIIRAGKQGDLPNL